MREDMRGWMRMICACLLCVACKPTEKVVYVPKVQNVVTTIKAHDTVVVVDVPETYAERVTVDTVSVLSTEHAVSRAEVSGGRLRHTLETRGEVKAAVRVEERVVHVTDSIPYRVDVPVYIERELRWWQTLLMWVGAVAVAVVAARIGWKRIV